MACCSRLIRIHPRDNVSVAVQELTAGETVKINDVEITARESVPRGHKVALAAIAEGENVIKYGFPIGHATTSIDPGTWVHVQNVRTDLSGLLEYTYEPEVRPVSLVDDVETFEGFIRPNGEIGVRNEIWIVPTVGCVNEIAKAMARRMNDEPPHGSVDGVFAWPHPHGCSQLGTDHEMTQKLLAGLVRHPNAGGVLVLGLGCENNTVESFRRVLGEIDSDRVKFLMCQHVDDEMTVGLGILRELREYAGGLRREPVSVSRLRVGLKCGGSDGLSGITGNPLLGAFSDMLIARGGTTVLTEVPEMFGAETLLMNRCVNREVFDKCVRMINEFKKYFLRHNQAIYENPSAGNKDAGITTLEDKSLGCIQKGGTSPVVDVLEYGDRLEKPGLNLLAGPGNDLVAVTVLAAAGAHLILFTTGLGTPLGAPVPTIKISTNSDLAARKSSWIDFDAGVLLEGASMQETVNRFFPYVLDVASGLKRTRNEENAFREIAIFKDGVTG
jgi:altronate hydrolase